MGGPIGPGPPTCQRLLLRRVDEPRARPRLLRPLVGDDPIPKDRSELTHEGVAELECLPLGVDLAVGADFDHLHGRRHGHPTQSTGSLRGIGLAHPPAGDHQEDGRQLIA